MSRLFKPLIQLFDASGATASAGIITFFAAGTTTLNDTFQDAARTLANTNPVTVDGSGLSPPIYLQYLNYTILAQDSDGGFLWQEDFDGRWLQDGSDYTHSGTGAVARTVQARLEERVSVLDFGANTVPGTTDMTAATQAAIDHIESVGGGIVDLDHHMLWASGITIDSDCVTLQGKGGTRNKSDAVGTRIDYSGSSKALFINDANAAGLIDFRIEATGTGTIGIHYFNVQHCFSRNFHVREFLDDNLLLECDTNVSSIYNTWINCSGFRTTTVVANGLRMLEGAGKAVNNNLFMNCNFGGNLVGIQQDSNCNDNAFIMLELNSCTTGAIIRGRTEFGWANIENCTTGLNVVSGSEAVVSGSIHFGGNGTNISNSGNRPIPAILHGGGTSSGGWNTTGSGWGDQGATPPAAGGRNYSSDDGDPVLQRAGATHISFRSSDTRFNQDLLLATAKNFSMTAAKRADPTATTTELEDISDDVNTGAAKVEGSMYFNATTNLPVWAVGNADGSVWVNATGATAHTPV